MTAPAERRLPAALAVPTVILYAAGYPIGAASVAVMSPFLVILLRFAASALLLWAILAVRGFERPSRAQVGHTVVVGLLTQAVQFLGVYWGLSHGVSSGLVSLIIALNPVVTAGLLAAMHGHRESRLGMAALVLATGAVILACLPKLLADQRSGIAVVTVLIAMLGLSLGGIHQARHLRGMDVLLIGAIGLTVSTPVAGVLVLALPQHVTDWPRALVLLAVMVVFSSVGATTLYAQCIRRSGARGASILFAVIPAGATVMGWLALGERLTGWTMAALVLGAAACLVQSRAAPAGVTEAEPAVRP
ncbi:DMT family transporter [Mariniluteicoccus flavus]